MSATAPQNAAAAPDAPTTAPTGPSAGGAILAADPATEAGAAEGAMALKALTLRQPYAALIAAGVKTIETRSQRTHHRGEIAIHAGLHRPVEGEDVGDWWWAWDVDHGMIIRQEGGWAEHPAPLGAIVAVADLVDCVPTRRCWAPAAGLPPAGEHGHVVDPDEYFVDADPPTWARGPGPNSDLIDVSDQLPYGDFTLGRWAWILHDIRPLVSPVSCPGAQARPWNVPADVEATVRAQIESGVPA